MLFPASTWPPTINFRTAQGRQILVAAHSGRLDASYQGTAFSVVLMLVMHDVACIRIEASWRWRRPSS